MKARQSNKTKPLKATLKDRERIRAAIARLLIEFVRQETKNKNAS